MLEVVLTNQFKKDIKLAVKRNYDLNLLDEVVNTLASQQPLDPKHKNHALKGAYSGLMECHITPDWLLVYKIYDNDLVLLLARTGTHSDLF